jgi:hypothetical protein
MRSSPRASCRQVVRDVMTGSGVDSFTGRWLVTAAELNYCPQFSAAIHPGQH